MALLSFRFAHRTGGFKRFGDLVVQLGAVGQFRPAA
jgi:hypothetical protein